MQAFGTTNFFRLMNSLDDERINPLRGEGAIAVHPSALETHIISLAPHVSRLGIDITAFRQQATNLLNLPRAWSDFIKKEARRILSADMHRLLEGLDHNFETKAIRNSEVNSIVHFVLSYYEVVHQRSINKKEVVEGVLMRGLIKKSSFYQKMAVADKKNESTLSWSDDNEHKDDIWRHFTLQTLRFMKQATLELDELLEDPEGLRQKLQQRIDKEEFVQFNQGHGRRSTPWMPLALFALGVGAMLAIPLPGGSSPSASSTSDLTEASASTDTSFPFSSMANLASSELNSGNTATKQFPINVPSRSQTVGFSR